MSRDRFEISRYGMGFLINVNKPNVIAKIMYDKFDFLDGRDEYIGVAKLTEGDEWSFGKGVNIAIKKALDQYFGDKISSLNFGMRKLVNRKKTIDESIKLRTNGTRLVKKNTAPIENLDNKEVKRLKKIVKKSCPSIPPVYAKQGL
jgi:hypothetical protein